MRGTVQSYTEKQGRNGNYYIVIMSDGQSYLAKDPATVQAIKNASNSRQEIEYTKSPSKDGTANWMKIASFDTSQPGGQQTGQTGYTGTQGSHAGDSRDASFAASYAKDITVACIAKGMVNSNGEITNTLSLFFDAFMKLLSRKSA